MMGALYLPATLLAIYLSSCMSWEDWADMIVVDDMELQFDSAGGE